VAGKKPVLVIKGGTGGGAQAALSHTASLAGSHEAFKACCEQAGFYLVEELTEDPKILVNVLSLLTSQPRPVDDRIAVVSGGGGAGILIADQITEEGLNLAEFTPATKEKIQKLFERGRTKGRPDINDTGLRNTGNNPVDLLADCDDERLIDALKIVDEDPHTGVVIAAVYLQVPVLSEYLPERLVELKRGLKKPLVISPRGFSDYVARCRRYMASKQLHTYTVPMIKPLGIALDIWKKYGVSFVQ
jgi:acyl-CoA synthetase (NDP forming)